MDSLLFSGTSNKPLADKVGHLLKTLVPYDDEPTLYHRIVPGQSIVSTFSDGETRVEIQTNVRGLTAFIVQSTCKPINDSLMELMLLADALRRSSAAKIVAVVPYYGYSRQDRRPGYSRVPISARVVADMVQAVGIDHIVTVDLHATQAQGFFTIPTDNISATPLFVADIRKKWFHENPIIVSPDVGGVARARTVAKQLQDMELAIVDKRRPKANVSEVMNIIGDVKDKTCIMVDDMVDTAGTLCKAADALMQQGARRVVAYCTHPVLSGNAKQNIEGSSLEQLIVTDTIPLTPEMQSVSKIRILSTAKLIAETINRIDNKRSISEILDR